MRIKKGFELRDVCGEHIVVAYGLENIDFSKVVSLNESAAFLWRALEGSDFDVRRAADALRAEYDVDEATALADAGALLDGWRAEGLAED